MNGTGIYYLHHGPILFQIIWVEFAVFLFLLILSLLLFRKWKDNPTSQGAAKAYRSQFSFTYIVGIGLTILLWQINHNAFYSWGGIISPIFGLIAWVVLTPIAIPFINWLRASEDPQTIKIRGIKPIIGLISINMLLVVISGFPSFSFWNDARVEKNFQSWANQISTTEGCKDILTRKPTYDLTWRNCIARTMHTTADTEACRAQSQLIETTICSACSPDEYQRAIAEVRSNNLLVCDPSTSGGHIKDSTLPSVSTDGQGPIISNIQVTYQTNQVTISWTTDKETTSSLNYRTSNTTETKEVSSQQYSTSHSMIFTVYPGLSYFYSVQSCLFENVATCTSTNEGYFSII